MIEEPRRWCAYFTMLLFRFVTALSFFCFWQLSEGRVGRNSATRIKPYKRELLQDLVIEVTSIRTKL